MRAAGKSNIYGWRAEGLPANPNNAHLKYRMTNIGTLKQQLPVNLASEIRQRGKLRTMKNELMGATWSNGHKVAQREGVNVSAFAKGGKTKRKTRKN